MSAPQAHQTPKTTTNDVNRRSANFSSTIWGDYFLSYASIVRNSFRLIETNIEEEQRIQELKERVTRMIMAPTPSKSLKKLELIDAIQRLGVSRHFENEIDQVLLQIHNNSYHCYYQGSDDDEDLHAAALYF
ncbi:hypothetical protein DVH24_004325 [Malus domestica]|uniref:Terpene synthase N-terminal domain-containing protein n=1 Tax=Malus domestica TaxID=3750 RepID=A0A498KDY1_MALDO|nr:hypothetical protein DVH24_004325 [Malus domestica]